MDAQTVEKLKSDHPGADLRQIAADGEVIVVKPPSKPEFDRFVALLDTHTKSQALGVLLFACRVHPSADALTALFERKPGLVFSFGNELCKLAGLNHQAEMEKL